jgi:hypothetical protein
MAIACLSGMPIGNRRRKKTRMAAGFFPSDLRHDRADHRELEAWVGIEPAYAALQAAA